ncbi:ABC transporter G family member 23 [Folsomia candida]|uniref:ABC transporter G family member 23 n=1 Tax=Folsomia candida TaxID=158441 RepID=A0A226CXA4_FOLCA|nr:ABC transporter G family member 23 [Folsomia candida]
MSALNIVSATKSFSDKVVLQGVDIKVEKGTIYALLGPSGCGKTTLISCIVGIQQLHEGSIEILGKNVTNFKNGIPGSLIGYMPQEASLTGSLTIMETFTYYGSLNGVPSHEIISKVETLRTIMNLPNLNSRTNQISGGEQRRVSLCVALLHDPEILLLDEPTTGIDPLLRERIWDYLRLLVESKGTTVFVTTHYVHETRQCKQIGYLRDGSMLVQDSPSMLLDKYGPNCNLNTASLDDVILHLCKIPRSLRTTPRKSTPAVKFSQVRKEPDLDQNVEILSFKSVKDDFINMSGEPIKQKFDPRLVSRKYAASKKYCVQVKALAIRNVIIYMRFISYPMLQLVVILINMLIGLYALGYNPKGLNLGAIMDNGQIHCDTNFAHQISSVYTIWPIEAVVWWYRPFCHCLPMTVTIRVLRSVITRGYALLGPSGCGKTTLISCIVGIQQLHEGRIEVFGKNVTNFKNGIPLNFIGYMPQDTSLTECLTIMETFTYYGTLHCIPSHEILSRVETLKNVMNLPNVNRTIKQISGGEQRRVSLCVALLHDPEILLLDEPTTGIDPVLRERY